MCKSSMINTKVLVLQGPLVERCKNTLQSFYGEDPKSSESLGRIVNGRHFK